MLRFVYPKLHRKPQIQYPCHLSIILKHRYYNAHLIVPNPIIDSQINLCTEISNQLKSQPNEHEYCSNG